MLKKGEQEGKEEAGPNRRAMPKQRRWKKILESGQQ